MPVFSLGRNAIFTSEAKVPLQFGGFPDLYALLSIPRDATPTQLDTAITSRAADLLAASFTRGGKGELLTLLRRHIADFRPILLDETLRASYDAQLRRHQDGEIGALSFERWKQSCALERPSRGLRRAPSGFAAHLKSVFWDAEYI